MYLRQANGDDITEISKFNLPPSAGNAATESPKEPQYSVGAYARLSRDDGPHKGISSSIETQKAILNDYAKYNELTIYDYYIDDGWSGTNFDRPAWKRMVEDIDAGKINMILAKDLSRIAREANEFGNFFETYCTEKGLRIIAITDGIDTLESSSSQIMEMLSMYNGWYPKDVSRKTRSAIKSKALQGKFVGNYPPFGYMKDPNDKNHLVPSEDAPLIREMFLRYSQGETIRQIADDFNARNIITPSVRINTSAGVPSSRVPENKIWNWNTIARIFDNIVYIGHMQQCKRENIGHKGKKRKVVPWNNRITVYDTHEAIVPVELWNEVQEKRNNTTKIHKTRKHGVNLFSGFVRCSDCGRILSPMNEKGILRCSGYNNGGKNACSSHTIRYDALYEIVLSEIQHDAILAEEKRAELYDALYATLSSVERKKAAENTRMASKLVREREKIVRHKQQLLESKWDNDIDSELYSAMMREYQEKLSFIDKELTESQKQVDLDATTDADVSNWMSRISNSLEIRELNRHILSELIDCIVVHECEIIDGVKQQKIEIKYKFIGNALCDI